MFAHTDQKEQMYAHSYKTRIFLICQLISMEIYDYIISNMRPDINAVLSIYYYAFTCQHYERYPTSHFEITSLIRKTLDS